MIYFPLFSHMAKVPLFFNHFRYLHLGLTIPTDLNHSCFLHIPFVRRNCHWDSFFSRTATLIVILTSSSLESLMISPLYPHNLHLLLSPLTFTPHSATLCHDWLLSPALVNFSKKNKMHAKKISYFIKKETKLEVNISTRPFQ